jgi:hypothetical protein
MPWIDEPDHPFSGIAEKLKRSDENIVDLHNEIGDFFKQCKYPVLPDKNAQEWQDAVDYFKNLVIPKRFSVLSGEVVHHLRSCLDHVAWYFSSAQYRLEHENAIEFPVFKEEPLSSDDVRRFERKIKGITNPSVLSLIRDLQPYKRGGDAENDPIGIVHDMDRFDKHRDLTIVHSAAGVAIPRGNSEAERVFTKYSKGELLSLQEISLMGRTIKNNAKVAPLVSFPKFGKGKGQLVIPALIQLHQAIVKRVDMFASLV